MKLFHKFSLVTNRIRKSLEVIIKERILKSYFYRYIKILSIKTKIRIFRHFLIPIKTKIENFIGYSFSDIGDALSLTSLILIIIKAISLVIFNYLIPPQISYLFLFDFMLFFLIVNMYYDFREYILVPSLNEFLGWHYIKSSVEEIEDNDERVSWEYPDTFVGKIHLKISLLFFPFFRKFYFLLIILRIFIIQQNYNFIIFNFLLFQVLIFNKLLLLSIILSLSLNLSRNFFKISDFTINNLITEINRLYGPILTVKNYKLISFWTLRGIYMRPVILNTKNYASGTKHSIQHFNSTLGKTYMRNKITHHGIIIKRNFSSFKYTKKTFSNKRNLEF